MTKKDIKKCPKPKLKVATHIQQRLKLHHNQQFYFTDEWVCDFETITANTDYFKKHKRTGIVYGYLESMEFDDLNYKFNKIDDLFKFFKTRRNDQIVYFHNLSFDGVFISDWLGENQFRLSKDDSIGHTNKFFRIHRTTGNKIYLIDVTIWNDYGKLITIYFRCSYHILQRRVELLGKDAGIEKYDGNQKLDETFYDREPCETVEEFEKNNYEYCLYCMRDVKIVKQCLKDFYIVMYEFLERKGQADYFTGLKRCITIAAISLKLQVIMLELRGYTADDNLYLKDYKSWKIMDRFTNGGLTTYNKDYVEKTIETSGCIIDLKSAYPSVMAGKIPIGAMLYEKPNDFSDDKYCTFYEVYYDHIKAKGHNIPLLKTWHWETNTKDFGNYESERTNYTTCLLKDELERIEQLHEFTGKKILNTYYFKIEQYLTDFVDEMFKYKEYYKKINQPSRSHAFKIGVNAAYGIHAKRVDFKSVKPRNWVNTTEKMYELCPNINLNNPKHHAYIPNVKQDAYTPVDIQLWGIYSHKGLANYITGMTHVKLMDGIIHFGTKKFMYSDTDSLFLIDITKEQVEAYCGQGLGSWEIEKFFTKVLVVRSKLYQVWDEHGNVIKKGTAGFDGKKVDFETLIDDRFLDIENAIKVAHRVPGGLIIESVDKHIQLEDKKVRKMMKLKKHVKDIKEVLDHVDEQMIWINKKNKKLPSKG